MCVLIYCDNSKTNWTTDKEGNRTETATLLRPEIKNEGGITRELSFPTVNILTHTIVVIIKRETETETKKEREISQSRKLIPNDRRETETETETETERH